MLTPSTGLVADTLRWLCHNVLIPWTRISTGVLNLTLWRTANLILSTELSFQLLWKSLRSLHFELFIQQCENTQIYSSGDLSAEILNDLFHAGSCSLIHCFLYLFKELILCLGGKTSLWLYWSHSMVMYLEWLYVTSIGRKFLKGLADSSWELF